MVIIHQIASSMLRHLHEEKNEIVMRLHSFKDVTISKEEFDNYFDAIYKDCDMTEDLEEIFEIFNIGHPETYCGRSLSSGDVVQINKDYYLCLPIGWKKLEF